MPGHFGDFLSNVVQVLILTFAIHKILRLFRGTRSAQIVVGIALIAAAALLALSLVNLDVVAFLLKWIIIYLAIVAAVIFQPELRHGLARIGSAWRKTVSESDESRLHRIEMIAAACERLSSHRHGALIAIERKDRLRGYEEHGTRLDVPIRTELLTSIFFPNAPLHDGGVTIVGDTISAARCVFPLTQTRDVGTFGTRHRAAIGLSEETDAVVVVVSEETGAIRIVCEGRYTQPLNYARLVRYLKAVMPLNVTDTWRRLGETFMKGEEEQSAEAVPASAGAGDAVASTETKGEPK